MNRCACGMVVCRIVPDWKAGLVFLCGPHWKFWAGERLRVELPVAQLELAESREADPEDHRAREIKDWQYFWRRQCGD